MIVGIWRNYAEKEDLFVNVGINNGCAEDFFIFESIKRGFVSTNRGNYERFDARSDERVRCGFRY
jgi:hypothetical protein